MRKATTVLSEPLTYIYQWISFRFCDRTGRIGRRLDDLADEYFEHVVEASEAFDEHVGSFVAELIAPGNEEVEGAINVKIKMPGTYKRKNAFLFILSSEHNQPLIRESHLKWRTRRSGLEQTR